MTKLLMWPLRPLVFFVHVLYLVVFWFTFICQFSKYVYTGPVAWLFSVNMVKQIGWHFY